MANRVRFSFGKQLKEQQEPNHRNLVWVQCKERRCLAFLNNKGKWIDFYTGEKLKDFVKVVE